MQDSRDEERRALKPGCSENVKDELAAGLIYLALTLVIMYPVSARPLTLLPVHGYDTYQINWAIWWFRYAALHGLFPADVTMLYAPTGVYFPMLWTWATSLAPGILLIPLVGLIGTYNLLTIASFVLSGVSMYVLAREVTGSRAGAFVAGLIFTFAPGRTIRLVGHFLLLQTVWLPLYVLFLLRLIRRPQLRSALGFGLSLAMVCLSHMLYAAYFALPVTAVVLGFYLITERRTLFNRPFVRHGVIGIALALLLIAPFFGPYLADYALDPGRFIYEGGDFAFSSDLLSLVVPSQFNPLVQRLPWLYSLATRLIPPGGNGAESTTFLGWLAIILAIVGLATHWRQGRLWLGIALVAAILALGPVLRVGGEQVTLTVGEHQTPVWLPYAGLAELPLITIGRTPGRFGTTTLLAVAILAAWGVSRLTQRGLRPPVRIAACTLLTVAMMAEYLIWWPLIAYPTPVSPFLEQIRAQHAPGELAILNTPMFVVRGSHVLATANYDMIDQPMHEQRIAGGYITRWPAKEKGFALALNHLATPAAGLDIASYSPDTDIAGTLRALGFDYVVVHKPVTEASPTAVAQQAAALGGYLGDSEARVDASRHFTAILGTPEYEDEILWAWRVPEPTAVAVPLIYFDRGWFDPQRIDGLTFRWLHVPEATFYIDVPAPTSGTLTLDISARGPARVVLTLGDKELITIEAGVGWQTVQVDQVDLPGTSNRIQVHAEYPDEMPYYVQFANVSFSPAP